MIATIKHESQVTDRFPKIYRRAVNRCQQEAVKAAVVFFNRHRTVFKPRVPANANVTHKTPGVIVMRRSGCSSIAKLKIRMTSRAKNQHR